MKKILLTITSLSLTTGITSAQELNKRHFNVYENSKFECIYQYTIQGINYNDKEFKEEYKVILQAGDDCAKFWDYGAYLLDSIEFLCEPNPQRLNKQKSEFFKQMFAYESEILQNIPKGQITENGVISINYYTYSHPLEQIEWSLEDGVDTILNMECSVAVANYCGREWRVWYTPEIPVSYGPWKLVGLPGLVLKAQESSGMHSFEAVAIRNNQLPIYNKTTIMRSKIKQEQFHKAKTNIPDIPIETISSLEIQKNDSGGALLMINGIPLRTYPNGYNSLEVVEGEGKPEPNAIYEQFKVNFTN